MNMDRQLASTSFSIAGLTIKLNFKQIAEHEAFISCIVCLIIHDPPGHASVGCQDGLGTWGILSEIEYIQTRLQLLACRNHQREFTKSLGCTYCPEKI